MTTTTTFQDTSTDCAICLLPLFDEKEDDDENNNNNNDNDNNNKSSSSHNNSSTDVITLTCGHRWHLSCIKNQLQHAQPNPSRRLVFRGTTCAKCNQVCSTDDDHPELNHLTRKIDSLRSKVEELIREQLLVDIIEIEEKEKEEENENENENNNNGDDKSSTRDQRLMEYAWRKYAFYLCSNCKEPYFGGTIECADQPEGEIQDSKDRLCIACSSDIAVSSSSSSSNTSNNNNNNQSTNQSRNNRRNCCRNIAQHRSFLVWKCRYCCKPSTYVCYGNVHFCNDCHQRNTIRVQQQNSKGPPLEPIPCPSGGDGSGNTTCPYPKPAISTSMQQAEGEEQELYHKNGPTRDCEQIYGCTLCESSSGSSVSRWDIPNGSRNLIINPSGEDGLRGWQVLRMGGGIGRRSQTMPWQVETSDLPTVSAIVQQNDDNGQQQQQQHEPTMIRTNFVSSFMWCQMVQNIPLWRYVHNPTNIQQIEVAAQYRGRTDCPSIFKLEVILLNQQNNPIHRASTQILDAPQDGWDRTTLLINVQSIIVNEHNNNSTDVHSLLYIIHGKDRRFWQGLYGSKVCDCSVRILGSNGQLQELLLPNNDATVNNNNIQQQGQRHQPYHIPQQVAADNQRLLLQQAILPIVCLILFLWLFGS